MLDAGENPVVAKRKAAAIRAGVPTFGTVADAFVKAKESEWRNEKHKAQWRASLTDLAAPLRALARSLGTTTAKLAHRYAFGVDVDTVILGVKNRVDLRECLEAEAEGALSAQLTRQIDEAVGRR